MMSKVYTMKVAFSLFLGLLFLTIGEAQKMKDISPFQQTVDQMNLELSLPKGKEFRYLMPKENDFIDYQIRIAYFLSRLLSPCLLP